MIFAFMIPEDGPQRNLKKYNIMTETQYFERDRDKLSSVHCPNCKEHELFRGGVYIGCSACMNYFTELNIIEANMEGE